MAKVTLWTRSRRERDKLKAAREEAERQKELGQVHQLVVEMVSEENNDG